MSTDRQIDANRSNARKSTGPRTADGKARVAENPLKHGLVGRHIVLPNEKAHKYNAFRAGIFISLEPEGGSPTGKPTGPVLYSGKLLQATPPTFAAPSP